MPFADPFDPTTPGDLADASFGDDRIRELKRALIERLDAVINNFSTGAADTDLTLKSAKLDNASGGTGASISYGNESAKPNPATTDFYYATDSNKLFVKDGTAYTEFTSSSATLGRGTDASKPNPATFEMYWAEDTNILYVKEGSAYTVAAGGSSGTLAGMSHQVVSAATNFTFAIGTNLVTVSMPLVPGNVDTYVVIATKARAKKTAETYQEDWAYMGTELTGGAHNTANDLITTPVACRTLNNGTNIQIEVLVRVESTVAAAGSVWAIVWLLATGS